MGSAEKQPFDPYEELAAIKRGPKSERRQRIDGYKEQLIEQRELLARFQSAIIEIIRANPDLTLTEFRKALEQQESPVQFSRDQENILTLLFQAYTHRRKTLTKIRELCPDPSELYRVCFGKDPSGKVELIESPFMFYFRAHRSDDYAWVHTGEFFGKKYSKEELLKSRKGAQASGGVTWSSTLIKGLSWSVAVERAVGSPYDEEAQSRFTHEEQHVLYRLFEEAIGQYRDLAKALPSRVSIYGPRFKKILEKLYPQDVHAYEQKGCDELLAYLKQGKDKEEIYKTLTKVEEKGGRYDFFAQDKKFIQRFKRLSEDGAYDPISNKILIRSEHEKLIREGLDASETLRQCGYNRNEIVAILTGTPLREWKKTAKRFWDIYIERAKRRASAPYA